MKISGYCTTRNCVEMDYPFEEAIKSLLDFCDEVVVADSSNGKDKTQEVLKKLMNDNSNLFVYHVDVPWDAPNHGIYDGQMKAVARSKCTGDYLWQADVDEIVEPEVRPKIDSLISEAEQYFDQVPVMCLPVVEYWGSKGKVRVDVNPWKWRLSKNLPHITHGIPLQLRKYENGLLYAKHGTDGCNYIDKNTGNVIPSSNFVTDEVDQLRQQAKFDIDAARKYENWFNMVTTHLPTVYHFSWFSIENKIRKFKYFWNDSWLSLYNEKKPKGWNPFFADKSLTEVSDAEIHELAKELELKTGGHIFHVPWDGTQINSVKIEHPRPEIVKSWCDRQVRTNLNKNVSFEK